ncbi:DNA repair protein RecN [Desulfosarcina ovata subsp. sediminis]|uniref:DNA repair protein RecN n=1 Tax=Desulfosarcina ovata subsp. sediminis TaxID=885957 RepID=A0A5K7ZVN3_9BACT|nr:DNA repair protein RecN [Desulfosarcina ovata]BBO84297.1 DNA repair protein RecN [Desulfosarcina ovata subsp. sediminis]
MLRELLIKNFAIIDDLHIHFEDGLTILSGETGAGKSIIINAVNLLLGARASARMIRDGCDVAELSAFFEIPAASGAAAIMAKNGYDPGDGLLVRRVIAANDRHRIYINDRMATIQMLSAITADLASISGQHANQGLLREETHLAILDRFGGLMPLVEKVGAHFAAMVPLVQSLEALKQKKANQEKELDLLRFQAAEIADAAILPDEDLDLEKERMRLKHAELLNRSVASAIESLHGADGAILEQLGEIRKSLEKAVEMDEGLADDVTALCDHLFGLEDVTDRLRAYLGRLDTETDRLETVEARLDLVNRMKRKYGGSLAALFQKRDAIDDELGAIDHLDDDIADTEARLRDQYEQMANLARDLSEKRRQVAANLARSVEAELGSLKMAGTRFGIDLTRLPCGKQASAWLNVDGHLLSSTGIDQAVFMIAPNVGESLKPLSAIASGGELSRVVLALKAILAETDAVGTIIFDEVDAGIGGAVADGVGKKLKTLSRKHQLICITHLPQIARFGRYHYHIRKTVKDGRTTTTIQPMDQDARIKEIARMLGGEIITATAMKHARALLAS